LRDKSTAAAHAALEELRVELRRECAFWAET
jgi:hypothetical protein